MNLELGPDALCVMLDESRAAMQIAGKEVPKDALATICRHREFAHMHRNQMRTVPLASIAREDRLPCVQATEEAVMGQDGYVIEAEAYMREAAPGETCNIELLEGAKRVMEVCLRLGMLDRGRILKAWEDTSAFMFGNEPSLRIQAGQRRECK